MSDHVSDVAYPMQAFDHMGQEVQDAPFAPILACTPDGTPIDGPIWTGRGAAIGDILLEIDSRYAHAVYFAFPTTGASASVIAEGGFVGSGSWRVLTVHNISARNAAALSVSPTAQYFAVQVAGFPAIRFRLSVPTTTEPVEIAARCSSQPIPPSLTEQRVGTATRISGASGPISTTATKLMFAMLRNTTKNERFVQIANVASYTAGSPIAITIPIGPESSITMAMPGAGYPLTTAASFAITSDFAGTTLATAGDVLGTIGSGI